MISLLADMVVLIHFIFILFVLLGGLLLLWSKRFAWLHLPAVLWAAVVEFTGWICPLTPLENLLRQKSGSFGYHTGFIEHYLHPLIYPVWLTPSIQIALGMAVLIINLGIYGWVFKK